METLKPVDWKELWLKNYRGEGDTAELKNFVESLDFGAKKGANYLPWATAERIFRLQDGQLYIVKANDDTMVESDRVHVRNEIDDNGVVTEVYNSSYFVNVKAEWKGQSYTERYPIQDSSGKALMFWTQNDLNKSMQRAKVKAIAIVSGIGYKLYEDGDLQFEDDEKKETKQVDNAKKLNEQAKKDVKPAPKQETKPEQKKEEPKKEEPKVEHKEETKQEHQEVKENVEEVAETNGLSRVEYENEIKLKFLGDKDKQKVIRDFLSKNNTTKFNELSDEKIKELYKLIK